ncbi:MAG: hypothetical protein R3F50_21985 [Gammaproteobacteria bacterium]|jgi:hypothetical protein
MQPPDITDLLPDVRDGLNRKERTILYVLKKTQEELQGRNVPTIMLYGRVVEHIDMSQEEFQAILNRLVGLTRSTDM